MMYPHIDATAGPRNRLDAPGDSSEFGRKGEGAFSDALILRFGQSVDRQKRDVLRPQFLSMETVLSAGATDSSSQKFVLEKQCPADGAET